MSVSPSRIINEANTLLSTENNRKLVYSFLEKFSQCEVYTRPILMAYYISIGELVDEEEIALAARTIKAAFTEAGIYFDDNRIITKIFGAEKGPGKSSCRWLRNKISHELMRRALKEVCERNNELLSDMDSFMCQIKAQS